MAVILLYYIILNSLLTDFPPSRSPLFNCLPNAVENMNKIVPALTFSTLVGWEGISMLLSVEVEVSASGSWVHASLWVHPPGSISGGGATWAIQSLGLQSRFSLGEWSHGEGERSGMGAESRGDGGRRARRYSGTNTSH
jgi:hypothetical protein